MTLKSTSLRRISKRPTRELEIEADHLWSAIILALTNNRCAKCNRYGCHAAHIVGRRNKHLRHHPKNGLPLCLDCHRWADNEDPAAFHTWLMHNYPDRHAMLFHRHENKGPMKAWMLEEVIEKLRSMK